MTASARRTARDDVALPRALPARTERRPPLVLEVMPDARRPPVLVDDDWWAPLVPLPVDPYGAPAPRPGLLVDVYG